MTAVLHVYDRQGNIVGSFEDFAGIEIECDDKVTYLGPVFARIKMTQDVFVIGTEEHPQAAEFSFVRPEGSMATLNLLAYDPNFPTQHLEVTRVCTED